MTGGVVGSVSVEVVPSTQTFNSRMRAAILPGADELGLEVGERIKAGIDERLNDIKVHAGVDDALAKAELDALKLKADELNGKKADIDVTVNNASGVRSWLVSLIAGATAIAPAFAVAGVGIGAFAALAVPSIAKVVKYEQDLGKNAAQAAQDFQGLTAEQKQMAAGITGLRSELSGMSRDLQPEVLQVFNAALAAIDRILPELVPLAEAGGHALAGLLTQIGDAMSGSQAQQFFAFVEKNLGPDVQAIGSTVASLIKTFFSLVEAMQPVSLGLLHVVAGAADLISILSRVAPVLDNVIVLSIALYKPLKVISDLNLASSFTNMTKAVQGLAAASDSPGLKFTWLTNAVSGTKELIKTSTAAAAVDAAMAAGQTELTAATAAFAVAADGTTVAVDELTASETAAAVASGALAAVNPLVWAGLAVAGVAALAIGLAKLADSSNKTVTAIEHANNAVGFNTQGYIKAGDALGHYAAAQDHAAHSTATAAVGGRAAALGMTGYSAAADKAASEAQKMSVEAQRQSQFLGDLEKKYGLTRDQAIAFARQAGVTAAEVNKGGSALADARAKVDGYVSALAAAAGHGTVLQANLDVLAAQTNKTTNAVQQLNNAWDQFLGIGGGLQTSFLSLESNLAALRKAAQAAGASMHGTGQASQALQSAFQQDISGVGSYADQLRTAHVSQDTFNKDMKLAIGPLTTFAKGNDAATSQLVALARQAGYTGGTSLRDLQQWLGNTSNAMGKLKSSTDQSTVSASHLASAASLTAAALESKLTAQLQNSGKTALASRTDVNDFVTAVQNTGAQSSATQGARAQLISDLMKAGLNAQQAAKEVDALARNINNLHDKDVNIRVRETVEGATGGRGQSLPGGYPGGVGAAGGTVVPGYAPGRDTRGPYWLSPGESVLVPELTRAIGPANIMAANAAYSGGRKSTAGHMAGGGITASAQFGFPQDVFNIVLNDSIAVQAARSGGGDPFGGFGLHSELRPHASASQMNADAKELSKAFQNAYKDTASQIKDETRKALSDIRQFYSGPAATRLESVIRDQGSALADLATASQKLADKIANIKAYAAQETQSLQSFSDISNIKGGTDASGNQLPVTGKDIQTGLQKDLATLRKFFKIIGQLKQAGLDKVFIAQVIALGPEDGVTYGEAVLAGGKNLIREINKEEKQISQIETKIGQRAADIQYGQDISKGFLSGLEKQKAKLEKEMQHLGDEIARELEKALREGHKSGKGKGHAKAAVTAAASYVPPEHTTSISGSTGQVVLSRTDVQEMRSHLRTIASRELTLMTKTQGAKLINLLEKAPNATGKATGTAVAEALNKTAHSAAAKARAGTR